MNTELFIARRIYRGNRQERKRVSAPAVRIATLGIAFGLAVMMVSVCIIVGFKKEVRDKVVGFGSHIQITSYDNGNNYERPPIVLSDTLFAHLKDHPEITHVQDFITKPGIIKTEEDFMGVILKGVSKNYDWSFFQKNLVSGTLLQPNDTSSLNQALISQDIADKMRLKPGDMFTCYFVQEPVRVRRFHIVGTYRSNFEEYDKLFLVTDKKILSALNGWDADMVSGIELRVNDFNRLDRIAQDLFFEMGAQQDRLGNAYYTQSIKEINPMIFNWLNLLDMNVWVIIILMVIISGFTMISGLLIIILERTNMIGILKAVGTKDLSIRKVFLYLSAFLIGKGMLWGNLIALLLCFIQYKFHLIRLDPATYYLTSVPIHLNLLYILLLNVGTLIITLLMMIIPSYLIAKITPAKSIRFE